MEELDLTKDFPIIKQLKMDGMFLAVDPDQLPNGWDIPKAMLYLQKYNILIKGLSIIKM